MDSAFIHQAANELVLNVGTRNIKQIARSCSLDISETSRIKDMLGLRAAFIPDSALEFLPIFSSLKCTKSSIFSGFLHSLQWFGPQKFPRYFQA